MSIDLYNSVQNTTGVQPDKKLFVSIRLYLVDYMDTSKPKDYRIKQIKCAESIIDYIIKDVLDHTATDMGSKMFSAGMYSAANLISIASMDSTKLVNMKDVIGFMKILSS